MVNLKALITLLPLMGLLPHFHGVTLTENRSEFENISFTIYKIPEQAADILDSPSLDNASVALIIHALKVRNLVSDSLTILLPTKNKNVTFITNRFFRLIGKDKDPEFRNSAKLWAQQGDEYVAFDENLDISKVNSIAILTPETNAELAEKEISYLKDQIYGVGPDTSFIEWEWSKIAGIAVTTVAVAFVTVGIIYYFILPEKKASSLLAEEKEEEEKKKYD